MGMHFNLAKLLYDLVKLIKLPLVSSSWIATTAKGPKATAITIQVLPKSLQDMWRNLQQSARPYADCVTLVNPTRSHKSERTISRRLYVIVQRPTSWGNLPFSVNINQLKPPLS